MASDDLILALAGAAAIVFLWLYRPMPTKSMTTTTDPRTEAEQRRGVQLRRVDPFTNDTAETDTGIDIIAIHGLDTRSPETWEYQKKDGNKKVNWLADQHMLPAEVPGTRIYTCDWPAELFEMKGLDRDRPILFIASYLGGVILMQALVQANDEYAAVREAARGIIFLATPFRGSSFQDVALWAQPGLRAWATTRSQRLTELLDWVNAPTFNLARLVREFTYLHNDRNREGFKVLTFYETDHTNLAAKVPLLSLLLPDSQRPLVDNSSATLDFVRNPLPLHRAHVLMNKFCGPKHSDPDYRKVVEKIQEFLVEIQAGTPLAKADAWIREREYDKQKLRIQRLSGDYLKMHECYINLALVQLRQEDGSKHILEHEIFGFSPFSLSTERLNLQAPHEDLEVELPQLFQPRELSDETTIDPRRILIRGHAGVGKTTLCKKIVYGFVYENMWQNLFKRVVWVRLRELKNLSNNQYNLGGLLRHIFFHQQEEHIFLPEDLHDRLYKKLWRHIEDTKSQDTLFLLDGLNEITEITMNPRDGLSHPGHSFVKGLLNRPNVIITTRPHAAFPQDFQPTNLELDTVGFNPDQVERYIEAVVPNVKDAIQAYLQKNQIMQSLVQIPILLDALCFTWQESSVWSSGAQAVPETMTAVYEAITKELWMKDNQRLEKEGIPKIGNLSPADTEPFDSLEYRNLGYLAFSGLCSNVIEFQPHHRNALYRRIEGNNRKLTFDETFSRLSFMRTSDPSRNSSTQSFHFIHLTFQEYFSAKYFMKAWEDSQKLRYTKLDDAKIEYQETSCLEFLQRHKYSARYNVMWRFVAGLSDAASQSQIAGLFETVERQPIDLLGPTPERLLMHPRAHAL